MYLNLVLTALFSCSLTIPASSAARIVGGHDIAIEEAPYQVSVQLSGYHECGGSIIAPNYIVTAAHCTVGVTEDQLSVRAGTSTRNDGGQVVDVKKISNHPKYSTGNDYADYDIAVLELGTNLELGFQVAVISLPSQNQQWPAGTDAFISGWGQVNELNLTLPINLQGATVQLVDQNSCLESYGSSLKESMFCAGVEGGGVDACHSDSGGPLQVDGILAGVVSFGFGCGDPLYPGVYTNVSFVIDFINEATGSYKI